MKYCPSCGKEWFNQAKFCPRCGFKRPLDKELNKSESDAKSREERTTTQESASHTTKEAVGQNSNEDPIKEVVKKNTYKSSEINQKVKATSPSLSKRKKPIVIGAAILFVVCLSTFLFIFTNTEPELTAEEKEALETYESIKEAQEYIKEHGYEEEVAVQADSQEEITQSDTASEEALSASETELDSSSNEEVNTENESIIDGTWLYPELNQIYEITFIDDFNGSLKIDSEESTIDISFQVTNYIDDNLEITTKDGEVWTMYRDGNELYIWKDNGVNLILDREY